MKIFSLLSNQSVKSAAQDIKQAAEVRWKEVPSSYPSLPNMMFDTFELKNKKVGNILISTAKVEGQNRYKILLNNHLGKELGYEEFEINPRNKNIYGFFIKVASEYRQRNYRFGELIRLLSIMEMVKNNSRQINIYSKDTAIYFHKKYKFSPCIFRFEERDYALQTIMKDKSKNFSDLAKEAQKLYLEIEKTRNNPETQRELCKPVNELVDRYIQRALQESNPAKKHPFNWGMNMRLTLSKVRENKDFFNSLFEKHKIDFKIK